jgi:RimJ/RimL family protein N-acetyltransferase
MGLTRSEGPLFGQKVTLRLWQPDEAEWYVSARDEAVFRFTTESRTLTVDVARKRITDCVADQACVGYAIVEAASSTLAGNIALSPLDANGTEAEVMYWLAAAARGRGLATDAVRTLVDWAFRALPIVSVCLLTDSENLTSQQVALRCGFEPRGTSGGRMRFVRQQEQTRIAYQE